MTPVLPGAILAHPLPTENPDEPIFLMSYKYLSPKSINEQDYQWSFRTLEGELKSFENRTLVRIFDKYLAGKKAKIIEAGCGIGAWCEWFRQQGHDVIGIERNESP